MRQNLTTKLREFIVLALVLCCPLLATAQQLGCDDQPFNGFLEKTCRDILTDTITAIYKIEADQAALEARYAERCQPKIKRTANQKQRCKVLKQKIKRGKNFGTAMFHNIILPNQMRTCECAEVTDPFFMRAK